MRMIDADALKEKAFGKRGGLIHTSDIDAMPTIEPKKGEWRLWDGPNWYICSECGAVRRQITFMEYYCPNCGARMENADDSN